MRDFITLALLGSALLTAGCGDLLSLHALYTDQDKVFDANLEGRWHTKEDLLIVSRTGGAYQVTIQSKEDPSNSTKYQMRLVDIKGIRFADVLPLDGVGHMFLRARV